MALSKFLHVERSEEELSVFKYAHEIFKKYEADMKIEGIWRNNYTTSRAEDVILENDVIEAIFNCLAFSIYNEITERVRSAMVVTIFDCEIVQNFNIATAIVESVKLKQALLLKAECNSA